MTFENFNMADVVDVHKETEKAISNFEKLLETNPMKQLAHKHTDEAWGKLRSFVDEWVKEESSFYKERYNVHYDEAFFEDKPIETLCNDDKFMALMRKYVETII